MDKGNSQRWKGATTEAPHSLVPGEGLVQEVSEGGDHVLVADSSHAAEGSRTGLGSGDPCQLVVEAVNQVRDLCVCERERACVYVCTYISQS